jgi:hypothetical protein
MKKNINFTILLILFSILLSSCGSIQKALDPQNKNTSDEFLVEKKSPLSMPPSFEELPVPSNQKITEENKTNNIKLLIIKKNSNNEKSANVDTDKDFEQSILDKIKNN